MRMYLMNAQLSFMNDSGTRILLEVQCSDVILGLVGTE